MEEVNSVELGNNFELGTKYSDLMEMYYQDENGNKANKASKKYHHKYKLAQATLDFQTFSLLFTFN